MEKQFEYAAALTEHLAEIFNEDSLSYIDAAELNEGDNLTHFIHALANIVPCHFFNKVTGDEKNNLEFNHIANQIVFQYSKEIMER